ncbi:MAG TPA: hypothetical protein VIO13_11885 [Candidatus Dormibacteraeota bacterium]|jgi:cytochrome c oxidase subunit IV
MRRHPADLLSFVFGAVFLAAGSLVLFDHLPLVGDLRWAGPVLLIVIALAMLASLRGPSSGAMDTEATAPVDEVEPPSTKG